MIFIVYPNQALYLYSYIFIRAIILIMMRVLGRDLRLNANFSPMLLSPSRNRPLKTLAMSWYFGAVSAGLIASNSPIARARTRAGSSAVKSSRSRRERGEYIHDFRLSKF